MWHAGVVGASINLRPDGRRFISLRHVAEADYARELSAAVESSPGQWHLHVDMADSAMHDAGTRAGFVPEMVGRVYEIPFASVIVPSMQLRPGSHRLCAADTVSPDDLFQLDLRLRQEVPGLNGWQGGRESFDNELASDEFDPTGYLVGRDPMSGDLVGLVRFWRNPHGPRLGLLGVAPEHRGGYLSTRLLQAGLGGASQWGFETFQTSTARPALQRRLERLGGSCTGSFAQMVRG